MSRVVVTVMPFAGHVGPLRPVVGELVQRGHEVRVHTGRRHLEPFRAAGADVVPWQEATDFDEQDVPATFPAVRQGRGPRQLLTNLEHVFVGTAGGQARDLAAAYAVEPWDVLLGDTTCFGAGLAAELTGAPWASISVVPLTLPSRDLPPGGFALRPGRGRLGRLRDAGLRTAAERMVGHALGGAYARARREAGLPAGGPRVTAAPFSPDLLLVTSVPRLEHPRSDLPPHVHFVGRMPAPPPGSAALPDWWPETAADLPVVHVTQGTYNTDARDLLLPTLEALADEPVLVVATTGRRGHVDLGRPVPGNARVTDFLPYDQLLPRTSVVVSNGGWGGVTAALANGVPLVVAGGDVDKPEIAARVAASGAGIDLRTGTPSVSQVREAVRTVLREPGYADVAAAVAADFARHDGPREVAALLQRLAMGRTPVHRAEPDPWTALRRPLA